MWCNNESRKEEQKNQEVRRKQGQKINKNSGLSADGGSQIKKKIENN